MQEELKEAYSEIIKVLEKYKDITIFDFNNLKRMADCHLFGSQLKETYGFNIDIKLVNSLDWVRLTQYMYIGLYGKQSGRTISWSDNKKQPDNELLLQISFPTGAYIFGDEYPVETFQQFFDELKTYNPKYSDSHNHNLYFELEKAGKVYNEFDKIFSKYKKIVSEDFNKIKIAKLEEELAKLKNLK